MTEAATGSPGALTGTVLSGRYRLEQKLGSGGMSTVYLARDETLERWVAAKVLHREISDQPDQIERFRREARAVAQVSHPNVVAVIDAGEDGGRPYIVFEYVEGETLKQRIDDAGRLPLDEAAAYAIEVGRGLAAAHARKLVHRDVKPQNVLIDPEGRAKVTEFGIARSLESDGLTATGRVLGTTDYVSPEQAMGREVDSRSDIYSLGVVVWEMLVGEPPFKAETLVGVAMKHVNDRMPDVQRRRREVSSALAAVVERATEKEPKKRYPEMGAMLTDLEGALEVEVARAGTSHGEATTVLDSVPDRRLLTPRRASIGGVLLVLAGTAAALLIAGLTGDENRRGGGNGAAAGGAIELSAAADFDPEGDGSELPEETEFAIDADPTGTAWVGEHYDTDLFGGLKEGVGIHVETSEPATPTAMVVRTPETGWDAEVYAAASGPPETLEEWGAPVGTVSNGDTETQIPLAGLAGDAQFFLLWFTKLPVASDDDRFRPEVGDLELLG
ncbi:MAG: protein kinase domain-containing protein [Solirubrobacterales bacterium]